MTNETNTENQGDKTPRPPAVQEPGRNAGDGPKKNAPGEIPRDTRRKTGGTGRTLWRLFLLLLLLLLLGALGVGGWFGWQWLEEEKSAYDTEIEAQSEMIARLESRLERVAETAVAQDDLDTLREQLDSTGMRLRDRMDAIAEEMDSLREAAQGGRRDLIKAEVEYLLRIAADELYLTQDIDTAIYALQAADDRLRQLAEPRLTPVRQLIADHLRALGTVTVADTSGMALKLGALMRQVSELPLHQAEHARAAEETAQATGEEQATWWQRVQRGVSRVFDKLVVVQRAEPPAPLLRPEEHFFLYRNVELQLAAARTALLMGDGAVYRQSLETAREWLMRFFDRNDPAVANAIADISGLLEVSLQPELPDINPALDRFRALSGNPLENMGARDE